MPFGVSFVASSKQTKAEKVCSKSMAPVPVPAIFTANKSFQSAFGQIPDPRRRAAEKTVPESREAHHHSAVRARGEGMPCTMGPGLHHYGGVQPAPRAGLAAR